MNNIEESLYEEYKNLSQVQLDDNFIGACKNGELYKVKFLLTSPELKKHADINSYNSNGFTWACRYGYLEIVKYLLTSTELKEHANIHADCDAGFIRACFRDQPEIVKYLIFEMNIEKTEYIQKYLKDFPNEQVENMFKMRELNQKLHNDLNISNNNKQKPKL